MFKIKNSIAAFLKKTVNNVKLDACIHELHVFRKQILPLNQEGTLSKFVVIRSTKEIGFY